MTTQMSADASPRRALRLACLLLLFSASPALGFPLAGSAASLAAGDERDEVQRLERWPDPRDRQQLEIDSLRLRKAATPGMEQAGLAGVLAEGAAAVPVLLEALRREREPGARGRLLAALEQLTTPEHTRLLAQRFEDRSIRVRTFTLGRVAAFPDPGVRAAAEAARGRTVAALADPELDEAERAELREELYRASLCCASAGSLVGLDELLARAISDWGASGTALRTALAEVRGVAATEALVPELESADRATVVATLRMLAACGVPEGATARIRPLLDHTDNTVRMAAINAARGIVDGEPPLEHLPVFEALELAHEWKRRL